MSLALFTPDIMSWYSCLARVISFESKVAITVAALGLFDSRASSPNESPLLRSTRRLYKSEVTGGELYKDFSADFCFDRLVYSAAS